MAAGAGRVDGRDDFIPARDLIGACTLWGGADEIRARVVLFDQLQATGHFSRLFDQLWTRSGLRAGLDLLRQVEASPASAAAPEEEAAALREGIRAAAQLVVHLEPSRRLVSSLLEARGMAWPWLVAEILTRHFVLATEAQMGGGGWGIAYRVRQPDPTPEAQQQMTANWDRSAPRLEPPDAAIRRTSEAIETQRALLTAGWLPEGRRTTFFGQVMVERKVLMLCRARLEGRSVHWIADTMAKGDRTTVRRWIRDAEALLRGPIMIGDIPSP